MDCRGAYNVLCEWGIEDPLATVLFGKSERTPKHSTETHIFTKDDSRVVLREDYAHCIPDGLVCVHLPGLATSANIRSGGGSVIRPFDTRSLERRFSSCAEEARPVEIEATVCGWRSGRSRFVPGVCRSGLRIEMSLNLRCRGDKDDRPITAE